MTKPSRPRKQKSQWNADLDAAARVEIVKAFHAITAVHHYPVVAAARVLGISPSVVSGKDSLPFRYGQGGAAALRLTRRPAPDSRVGKLVAALKNGGVIEFQGRTIGGLP